MQFLANFEPQFSFLAFVLHYKIAVNEMTEHLFKIVFIQDSFRFNRSESTSF